MFPLCVITALNIDYCLPLETCRQLIFGEDVSFCTPPPPLAPSGAVDLFRVASVTFIKLEVVSTRI